MIESDRAITPLWQSLQKKYYMPRRSAWRDEQLKPIRLFCTIFIMSKYLQNILVDFRKKLKTENSPFCRPIYYPLTEATEFFLYTTTNVSERRRIWSSPIFHFQTFVTQTFYCSMGSFSILSRKLTFWKSTKISQFWEFFTGIGKSVRNKWRGPNSSSFREVRLGI